MLVVVAVSRPTRPRGEAVKGGGKVLRGTGSAQYFVSVRGSRLTKPNSSIYLVVGECCSKGCDKLASNH